MTEAKCNGQLVMNYRYNGKDEQIQRFVVKSNSYSLFDEHGHWLGDIPVALVGSNSRVGTAASTDQKLAYIEADHLVSFPKKQTVDQ